MEFAKITGKYLENTRKISDSELAVQNRFRIDAESVQNRCRIAGEACSSVVENAHLRSVFEV